MRSGKNGKTQELTLLVMVASCSREPATVPWHPADLRAVLTLLLLLGACAQWPEADHFDRYSLGTFPHTDGGRWGDHLTTGPQRGGGWGGGLLGMGWGHGGCAFVWGANQPAPPTHTHSRVHLMI